MTVQPGLTFCWTPDTCKLLETSESRGDVMEIVLYLGSSDKCVDGLEVSENEFRLGCFRDLGDP